MVDSENYLTTLPRFSELGADAIKPGTERVENILDAFGNPQNSLPIVHVAGTNGKGTSSSLISSILTAAGYDVGLFTSPHISSVRERFRINGIPISHELLDALVEELTPVFEHEQPSFFEAVTVAALLHFHRQEVDVAVVEVGLGGRLDATNIVSPLLSVITQIGLDHTDLLGENLEEIAAEKAGIIKSGVPVITGATGPALSVIRSTAASLGSRLYTIAEEVTVSNVTEGFRGTQFGLKTPVEEYEQLEIRLPGAHQLLNASIAVRSIEVLSDSFDTARDDIQYGLGHAQELSGLSARIELVRDHPPVILDVSHNQDGIRAAVDHVTKFHQGENISVALAMMQDKNIAGVMSVFRDRNIRLSFVRLALARAASPEQLQEAAQKYGIESQIIETFGVYMREYLDTAGDSDVLLVLGSHLLVEQARLYLD